MPFIVFVLDKNNSDVTSKQVDQAQAATPDWHWDVLGMPGSPWHADPWPTLCRADIVVTHAGQNAIAEVAAARIPAVVLPQRRPHGEQEATGNALRRGVLATVLPSWPEPHEWAAILAATSRRDGARWMQWAPGDGALRAASHLDRAVREYSSLHPAA